MIEVDDTEFMRTRIQPQCILHADPNVVLKPASTTQAGSAASSALPSAGLRHDDVVDQPDMLVGVCVTLWGALCSHQRLT